MSRICQNCGAELPDGAAFCPHCEKSQVEKTALKPPRPRRRRTLTLCLCAAGAIALGLGAWALARRAPAASAAAAETAAPSAAPSPVQSDRGAEPGGGDVLYSDGECDYRLALTFSGGETLVPEYSRTEQAAADETYALPSQLRVVRADTGEDAGAEFLAGLEEARVETLPEGDAQAMGSTVPAPDGNFPFSTLTSHITYNGASGSDTVRWTLRMKNGDVLTLTQEISVTELQTIDYYCDTTPMETTEELRALLDDIAANADPDAVVSLYLPPVTYEGGLELSDRTVNLYGGEDADGNRTTFTGTLTVSSGAPSFANICGVRFAGTGSGTGLSASAGVVCSSCEFSALETGAYAREGSWIVLADCVFDGCGTGLLFDSFSSRLSNPLFAGNTFTDNGTAVRLENVPGCETLAFDGCRFSGNGEDVVNVCGHPKDLSGASFG